MENAVITAVLSVLLVGAVVEAAEGRAAGAETRTGLAEGRTLAGEGALAEGLSLEEAAALNARLDEAESLETGARHPARLEALVRYRPSVDRPPPGFVASHARWVDYVGYWERRYEELTGTRQRPVGAPAVKPPLTWESYEAFLGRFQRAMAFQRDVARALRQEVGLAMGQRHLLRGLEQPLVTENVGLIHEGRASLTYVDQLVVDEASLRPGQTPVVHSFSNKQRGFTSMSEQEAVNHLRADAREAWTKYGDLVYYEETGLEAEVREALEEAARRANVELHFHAPQ